MKRIAVAFALLISVVFLSGCIASGASFALYGRDGLPMSEVQAKFKPIASFRSGSAADITNDSRYNLEVITMYSSEHGYWHSEKYFEVPAGYKGYAAIPAPGYTNWYTCGAASVTIRVVANGRTYSSVERLSVCNGSPTMPAYLVSDETVARRIAGNGELWDKPGWGW